MYHVQLLIGTLATLIYVRIITQLIAMWSKS